MQKVTYKFIAGNFTLEKERKFTGQNLNFGDFCSGHRLDFHGEIFSSRSGCYFGKLEERHVEAAELLAEVCFWPIAGVTGWFLILLIASAGAIAKKIEYAQTGRFGALGEQLHAALTSA
ncbi:hypothetical protein Herbaro_16295 [Herbaspirillum sp. WKF16]|uniref:hypothetical protein n=1 Tax=Herbaspirillum sp. WKF16 TaxID=3028312 RepID=UPI0023A9E550|nr:hypothetical protein [Herbaspirillum sp. WKF16]WDZ95035.1 hypothetical protein Herbaro_16295 [Herbaspirillum sp. WKF16]